MLTSGRLSTAQAQALQRQYAQLDVVQLKQQIDALLTQLKPSPLR